MERPQVNVTTLDRPRPRVLALIHTYVPGFQSGGPVRSLSALAHWLGNDISLSILTRDRDKDGVPYQGIRRGVWQRVGCADVYYATPAELSARGLARLINARTFDVLYLNSFFNPTFTFRPLLLRRLRLIRAPRVVVAPRGEFGGGAQSLKRAKKRVYGAAVRLARLFHEVTWHASTDEEAADIRRNVGSDQTVVVARNLSVPPRAEEQFPVKRSGELRLVWMARIAPVKNLLFAIEALRQVRGPLHIDIYGPIDDPSYWARCQASLATLPPSVEAKYCGVVQHDLVADTLAQYDAFVLPTLGENFGHAILDALTSGCPVIISDRTPWRDLRRDGVGWDVSIDRPEPFVGALQAATDAGDDEWRALRQRAREYGLRRANDPVVVAQNRELFYAAAAR